MACAHASKVPFKRNCQAGERRQALPAARSLNLSIGEGGLSELYFKSAPNLEEAYQVGDRVEVFCDHERASERVRDWLEGVVVQVDPKMIAVQFQESVYLTDGWMVPDHVLWCPKTSKMIRASRRRLKARPRPK